MSTEELDTVGVIAALRDRWTFASVATGLYWFGVHVMRSFVTIRLDELGASDAFIGLAVAAYPVLPMLLAIPGGRLVDRVGSRRILIVSLLAMALAGAGYAAAGSPMQIFVLQVVSGVAELGCWVSLQALVTNAGTGAFRTRHLSFFALSWGAGVAMGPVVGAVIYDHVGFAPLGFAYAAAPLLGAIAVLAVPPARHDAVALGLTQGSRSTLSTVRAVGARTAVRAVLLSSFGNLYINSMRQSFYPLFLERRGLPVASIGVLLTIVAVTSLVIRAFLPRLVRVFGIPRLIVWSMGISAAAVVATPALGAYWMLVVAAALMGSTMGMNPPLTVELMAENTATDERGVAMGMRVVSNRLAQVIQPLAFTGAAAVVGMAGAFPVAGVVLGALTLWTARETASGLDDPVDLARTVTR